MATVTNFDLNGSGSGVNEARTYQENAAAIRLAQNAVVAASGNFNGQTLTLSGLLPESQIGFASGASVSGTTLRVGSVTIGAIAGGTGGEPLVMTFNTNATAARVQTLIRNLTWRTTSDTPTISHTVVFDLAGTTRTDSITVTPVNDAPALDLNGSASGTGITTAFIEQTPVAIAPAAILSDINSPTLVSLTATLTSRPNGNSVESLSLSAGAASLATAAGLVVAYAPTTGALTIKGTADPATYQQILRGITYANLSDQPSTASRSIQVAAHDGQNASATATAAVTVAAVNDAPVVDLNGADAGTATTATHAPGGPATLVAPAAILSDIDSANFSGGSLRAQVTANGSAADQLQIVAGGGVTLSGSSVLVGGTTIGSVSGGANGAALVITLANTNATVANVQAVLRRIGYRNATADQPPREVTVTLNDGDGTANGGQNTAVAIATIGFGAAATNVAPILTGDLHTAMTRGTTQVLSTGDINFSDPDDTAADVTFSVSNIVNGELRLNGAPTTSFTGQQLAAGQVVFHHNGATAPEASFSVAVEDGNEDNSAPVARTFVISVNGPAGNAAPVLTGDLQATIGKGATYVITTADLFFTDADDGPTDVAFTTSALVNGAILLNGASAATFTGQQLLNGQVAFRHNGGTAPQASFAVFVEDYNEDNSTPVAQTFTLTLAGTTPANVAPTLAGDLQATIDRGATYVITSADLSFIDPDDGPSEVTFTVSNPANGEVRLNGAAATAFTGQQLAAGQVAFVHSGAAAATASFAVAVEDGNEDSSAPVAQTFAIAVNAPPTGDATLSFATATQGVNANLAAGAWSNAHKLMPFGDSITHGIAPAGTDAHGYRGFLWVNLAASNILVDMVGPNSNGTVADPNHAGYPGETADDLVNYLPGLLATYAPSTILLMGGTNDVFSEQNAQNTVGTEIAAMLTYVAQKTPATRVYVSTILPVAADNAGEVNAVNTAIRAAVATAATKGQNVGQVEMPSVTLSDLYDGIHPNDQGYREMADYWTAAILNGPSLHPATTPVDPAVANLTGSAQNDLLVGDSRANLLVGGNGNDWLRGEGGDDTLQGGAGNDYLIGGPGNDVITTGTGNDRIMFLEPDSGHDTVTDFTDNADKLVFDISATGVDAFADLVVSLVGGKVVVAWSPATPGVLGSGSVTLDNLANPALITSADIEFQP